MASKDYLPSFVTAIPTIEDTLQAIDLELVKLEKVLDEIEHESIIHEAGQKGLQVLEFEFGLSNPSMGIVERREALKAKSRGRGTTTVQMMKRTALAFDCGDIEVGFVPSEYKIKLTYVSKKGRPKNEAAFKQIIQDIIPAHLALEYFYKYTIWNDLEGKTWNDIAALTWDKLNIWEGN